MSTVLPSRALASFKGICKYDRMIGQVVIPSRLALTRRLWHSNDFERQEEKREGLSLMVAFFLSPDFDAFGFGGGWAESPSMAEMIVS